MNEVLKPYPAYKDSGVPWLGKIPEHWEVRRLKQICRFAYGDSLVADSRREGKVPVFGSNGRVGFHSQANTKSPCIVIGRKGSFGKVNFSAEPVFAIDTTFFIDSRLTSSNLRWLHYVLGELRLDQVSKDSAVPGLDREDAYQRLTILSPLADQLAIVRFLDYTDRRIRRYIRAKQKLIALLNEQKQAIIHKAVTRGLPAEAAVKAGLDPNVRLKPSGIPWLGDVPEHWEVVRMKSIASLRSGDNITALDINETGQFAVYGVNGLRGYTDKYTHDGEYVLIGRQGALCGNVNYASGKFWASEHAVVATPIQPYNTLWFGETVRVMNLNQYSISAAQPGLAVDRIKNLFLPFPTLSEQHDIAEYIKANTKGIDIGVESAKKQISLIKEYRTRLIADVVTGKLDVREVAARLPLEPEESEPTEEPEPIESSEENSNA